MYVWKLSTAQINAIETPDRFINAFFGHNIEYTYYFMFTILGVYLTMPVLSFIADKKDGRNILKYIAIMLFVTQSTIPIVLSLFGIYWNPSISIQIGGLMIFPILGYLLSTSNISKEKRILLYALGLSACLFRYLFTYLTSSSAGFINQSLFEYSQFHSVILAVAVFVLIKHVNWGKIIRTERAKEILSTVSSCSFGIYLSHMIVIYYEEKIIGIGTASIIWRTACVFLTYGICLTVIYLLKKMPLIRKIVP